MSVEITMPQLSDTMSEGTILRWYKQEGDSVKRGEALAEVATDKADLEIESFHEGTLVQICAPKGEKVKVGSVIAIVGAKGEQVKPQAQAVTPPPMSAPIAAPQAAHMTQPQVSAPAPTLQATAELNGQAEDPERIKISPLARNLAKTHGVDYAVLSGSGDGGRIVKKDIEKALGGPGAEDSLTTSPAETMSVRPVAATPISTQGRSVQPLSKMRQTIASRMVESTTTIPHFFATTKVNVDALRKLRNSLKPLPQYEGLTYNHLIVKASALALRVVPRINCSFSENNLIQPHAVNVGIVTAVPDGLLIPVLKNADQLPIVDIVSEARGLVQRARAGRPKPDDLVGGTFSISNMGMFDVEEFSAIISPGQGAILAVSPIQDEPIVLDGEVKAGSVMRLTLSVDHRIIDGVISGEFLTELKRLLEDPVLLLA